MIWISPKGGSSEPVWFSIGIHGEGPNQVLSNFVDEEHDHAEGKCGYSVVHEDVVSHSEGHVEW